MACRRRKVHAEDGCKTQTSWIIVPPIGNATGIKRQTRQPAVVCRVSAGEKLNNKIVNPFLRTVFTNYFLNAFVVRLTKLDSLLCVMPYFPGSCSYYCR